MNNSDFTIITFYQFKQIDYQEDLKKRLKEFCLFNKIRGTTIIAKEGINAQLSIPTENFELFKSYIDSISFLKGVRLNTAIE